VASIGTIADRGRDINADASAYRGGDFAGAGSGDFAFGPGGGGDVVDQGPVADLSLTNFTPGSDQNTTPYDQYGPSWENLGGDSWIDRMTGEQRNLPPGTMHDFNYGFGNDIGGGGTYNGGGIGSDAGATRGRITDILAGPPPSAPPPSPGGGSVGPPIYPPTPWGGGFDFRAPTYTGQPDISGQGPAWVVPTGGPTVPGTDPSWNGSPLQPGTLPGWGGLGGAYDLMNQNAQWTPPGGG
jgi:hypothetical protein